MTTTTSPFLFRLSLILCLFGWVACAPDQKIQETKVEKAEPKTNGHQWRLLQETKTHHGRPTFLFEIDFEKHSKTSPLLASDTSYFRRLMKKFGYSDSFLVYSLTDIKVKRGDSLYSNVVYQNSLEKSQYLIDLHEICERCTYLVVYTRTPAIIDHGAGGVSYHSTQSGDHILCLNGHYDYHGVRIDHEEKIGLPSPVFTASKVFFAYY